MPTATELRELEDDELDTRLDEYRRETLNLRFQLATGQLDNHTRLNEAKRNVARVLTVLRDREIAAAEGREAGPIFVEQPVRPARRRAGKIEDVTDEVDDVDDDVIVAEAASDEADEATPDVDASADEEDE
jgi:large subunit ribosomal protein L29